MQPIVLRSILCAVIALPAIAAADEGPNLIANPSLESASPTSPTTPQSWTPSSYGTNTVTFAYPVSPAADGSRAARIDVASYTSGDAKWIFDEVAVGAGKTYHFRDAYIATVSTAVTVLYRRNDGTATYLTLATPAASSAYASVDVAFTVPANVRAVTVLHLIKQSGSLTVDAYELREVVSAPTTGNLVRNPSLETANGPNTPYAWTASSWGNNTSVFAYPVSGLDGARAARVAITSYNSGDAKWYFDDVAVAPGASYKFSDTYVSTIPSRFVVRVRTTSGAFDYVALGSVPAAVTQQTFVRSFTAPANAASVTVFHLIASAGSLTIDDVSLTRNPDGYNLFAQGIVSLTWDDGYKATFDIVKPALDASGLPSTHFIITGFFGDPDYVSTADVLSLQASGNEIGAHSRTHRDLTTLSASEVNDEVTGSRQDLLAIGVTSVASFAYPYGAYNDTVLQTTKTAGYTGARGVLDGIVERSDDPYTLRRIGMQGGVTFDQARAAIDSAVAHRQWLVLVFHHVDNSGSYYSVTPQLFQQVIDYLVSQRTPVVTMSQGVGMLVK